MEKELPEGWVEVELSEICLEVQKVTPENTPDEYFNYIDIASVDNERNKVTEAKSILGAEAHSRARQLVKVGDTVFSTVRTYLKNIAYVTDELDGSVASTGFAVIRPIEKVESKYIFYYTLSDLFLEPLNQLQRGISYPAVKNSVVFGQSFPLPPLAEQKRIVAKLDETFQHLDTLKARLERIPELLKNFRQSVLTQAVTGKLTASKDKATQTHTVGGLDLHLPEHWDVIDFANLIEVGPQNGLYKPQTAYGSGRLILRIDNFYSGRVNSWDTLKRLELNEDELNTYSLANDDIVVNRVNSIQYLGKSALIRKLEEECVFESNVMRIKLNLQTSYPEYISLYLNSFVGLAELRKNAKHAVNQASINQQDVKSSQIILPPLEEQKEIVKRVEALFAKADAIAGYYATLKEKIDKLPQAILAKAFRGELVPQNPEDEPASVLLEKIKAAKAAAVKPAKGKKAKGGKQGELVL